MKATLYVKFTCPFCVRAIELLQDRGVEPEIIDVNGHPDQRQELAEKHNHRTVPMVFINDEFIGGCSELESYLAAQA